MSRRVALPSLIACIGCAIACDSDYTLAPTACDEWCRATLRADCDNDFPDECVTGCRFNDGPVLGTVCLAAWLPFIRCYAAASDEQFSCGGTGHSEPNFGLCPDEEENAVACQAEPGNACGDLCDFVSPAYMLNRDTCVAVCSVAGPGACGPAPCASEVCRGALDAYYQCLFSECSRNPTVTCAPENFPNACRAELDEVVWCAQANADLPGAGPAIPPASAVPTVPALPSGSTPAVPTPSPTR